MIFSSSVRANKNQQIPLIKYLSQRFTYHAIHEWQSFIATGKISVDGQIADPEMTVSAGQTIAYDAGPITEPPADLNYTVLYEDEWILAANKPGNLLIHRAGKSFTNNLMYQLRTTHKPPYLTAHSIHRLDRNTSGVVLIAKNPDVQSRLSTQFVSRNITKRYIAFIEGIPVNFSGSIQAPLAEDRTSQKGARFYVTPDGKEAITEIISCEPLGTHHAKVILQPHTGRTHQLRVHCAFAGHPIIGDRTYNAKHSFESILRTSEKNDTIHPRHALHCSEMTFFHPWKQETCTITAPVPDDMKRIEERLRKE